MKVQHLYNFFINWIECENLHNSRSLGRLVRLQTGQLGVDPWQRQRILLLASVQTRSEAHPVSYPVGYQDSFLRGKA
jgi:hypothetical protein